MTTYNRDPYFDDFDANKNYVRILFKPGVSVQARELTQLQTAIQQQIKSIGGFLFKNESLVTGGNSRTFPAVWIDVASTDLSKYVGLTMNGETSGAKIQVVSYKNSVSSGISRLYFVYKNGKKLQSSEIVTEDVFSPSVASVTTTNSESNSGQGTAYTIAESVFYVKDYFVVCSEQTIILSDNSTPSVKVGLTVTEDVVTYQDDETLLDPASGSYNYAAPGADRIAISLDLITYPYSAIADSDADTMVENTEDNFIELARYSAGVLVKSLTNPTLGALEDVFARRTYDESGDYTVSAFKAKAITNVKKDSAKLTLAIEPGKAYVKGYEFETTSTLNLDLEKARDTSAVNNFFGEGSFGDYFIINHPTGGSIAYNSNPEINLVNASVATIGTARVRFIARHSSTQLKLYVYNLKFTSGSVKDVTTVTNSPWTATVDGTNTDKVYRGKNQQYIVPLTRSPIRAVTDISYESQTAVTVQASSTTITGTTLSSGKTYPSSDPNDYIVVKADGTVTTGFTVTSSGGNSFVLTGTFTNLAFYTVFAKIAVSVSAVKAKTRTSTTVFLTNTNDASISLGVPDVYKIVSVYAKNAADTIAAVDVTGRYSLDRGQKDGFYDYGRLVLKSGQQPANTATYTRLAVTLEYFASAQTNGYYTVDSYDTDSTDSSLVVPYENIPSFKASTGKVIPLRDVIDFRPKRANVASFPGTLASPIATTDNVVINGDEFIEPLTFINADFEYYLPRIDKLIVTKEKRFDLIQGIASDIPQIPSDIPDAMTIYTVFVPAYTFSPTEVRLDYVDNRRYTMRDIGKIDKRVGRLEYYTAMSLLEKQAADETITNNSGIDKFKNGILVDPFAGHSVGDVGASEYSCSIDTLTRTLRPRFSSESFNFDLNANETSSANYAKNDDLLTLPFSTEIYVSNNQATNWSNLNPYSVFSWDGEIKLNPATDNWTDTTTRPDVVINLNGNNDAFTVLANDVKNPASTGTVWGDWKTVSKGVTVNATSSSNDAVSTSSTGGRAIETTETTTVTKTTTTVNETNLRPGLEIERSAISTVTRDLGAKVVDTSIVPFIRSRVVDFSATKLKPQTILFAAFDGVDVTKYCTLAPVIYVTTVAKATRVRKIGTSKAADIILLKTDRAYIKMDNDQTLFANGEIVEWYVNNSWVTGTSITDVAGPIDDTLTSDENGDLAGYFLIPSDNNLKFRTGERPFRLADTLGKQPETAAETKYVAQGLSMSLQKDVIATRVQTVAINPVSQLSTSTLSTTASETEITAKTKDVTVLCGETQSGNGISGRFVYELDFGTDIGACGINYDATGIPDRYTLIWNGRTYSTGFRGSVGTGSNASYYNNELNARGFPSVTALIDSNNTAAGKLRFTKTSIFPTKAQLIVDAPLSGTRWAWKAICPGKTDNLLPETSGRISVLVNAPATTVTRWTGSARFNNAGTTLLQENISTTDTGVSFNVSVEIAGNQNVPVGTPVQITSISRTETTNGRWAAFATGTRFFVNGRFATFPYTTKVGDTVVFTFAYDFTPNAKVQGFNLEGSLRNPLSTITVNAQLVTAIDGSDAATSGTDTVIHTCDYGAINRRNCSNDPLAQTFFVSSRENPDGIFVDSVDLFFKSKESGSIPVSVQIRTTENGYPSSKVILPFATSSVLSNDIQVSAPEVTKKAATKFEFQAPVYLAPDTEYALVVLANSDKFEVYTSRIGEFLLSNTAVRCTKQPLAGSLFLSQNGTTWTASQTDDMVFRLRKCVFPVNAEKSVVLNVEIPPQMKTSADLDYDTIFIDGEVLDFANTNVNYSYKTARQSGGVYSKDSVWNNYQLGSDVVLPERKTIDIQDSTTLRVKCDMKTSNRDVSPVIDLNRLSTIVVKNIVNNNGNSEVANTLATISSVAATTSVVTITTSGAHGYSVGDNVFVYSNTSNEINGLVTITTVPLTTTFTYDRFDGGATITSTAQAGTVTRAAQALSRYITRKVTLNSDFFSTDIKAYFLANIPSECAVIPYYRVTTLTDTILEDNEWIPMTLETTGNKNQSGFAEYKYKAPYTFASDTAALPSGERFGTFSVKLVLLSSNPVKVPMVKDLRVLALDD